MGTIVATLNAASPGVQADLITTDENLTFKVYNDVDSYTVPEIFGSHVTDSDVVVSAGGVVTISNVVEPPGVTAYKISSVDEAGNESIKSAIYSPTRYAMFTDATTWNNVEVESPNVDPTLLDIYQMDMGITINCTNPTTLYLYEAGGVANAAAGLFQVRINADGSMSISNSGTNGVNSVSKGVAAGTFKFNQDCKVLLLGNGTDDMQLFVDSVEIDVDLTGFTTPILISTMGSSSQTGSAFYGSKHTAPVSVPKGTTKQLRWDGEEAIFRAGIPNGSSGSTDGAVYFPTKGYLVRGDSVMVTY